jgi:4-hydroxyphenylpyruvate dioxygenase
VNRDRYRGGFAPGFRPIDPERYSPSTAKPVGLAAIDHIVGNVEEGKMNEWVEFYRKVLGFSQLVSFDDKDISTEYSALMSKVVQNGTGRIKFPINEPAHGKRGVRSTSTCSTITGPGVQHIALITGDIVKTVRAMQANDVSFLRVPRTYYETLPDRVGQSRRTSTNWPNSASSWTRTTKATCCRSSRSRSPTARRCSSK